MLETYLNIGTSLPFLDGRRTLVASAMQRGLSHRVYYFEFLRPLGPYSVRRSGLDQIVMTPWEVHFVYLDGGQHKLPVKS